MDMVLASYEHLLSTYETTQYVTVQSAALTILIIAFALKRLGLPIRSHNFLA